MSVVVQDRIVNLVRNAIDSTQEIINNEAEPEVCERSFFFLSTNHLRICNSCQPHSIKNSFIFTVGMVHGTFYSFQLPYAMPSDET